MNYEQTMSFIKNTAKFGMNFGLERTEKILELLGSPNKMLKCIHIAGTNGKGSTTAMLSKILTTAGYKIGMYTSPYIEEFEERIQINNINIPKERLCEIVYKVSKAVEEVIALGYDHPTEFEIITCAMFLYFYEEKVDFAVIEVGLGGRLDSTNVITPIVSVIASISYDHMNVLGSTLKEIAKEKCGIIKRGIPVVVYPQEDEAEEVVIDVAAKMGSDIITFNKNQCSLIKVEDNKQIVGIKTLKEHYEVKLSLLGKHQVYNCATVINTIEVLIKMGINITKEHILKGLSETKWIGRMEIMSKEPVVLIDGAHNVDGISNLARSIKSYFNYENMYLIIGVLGDKQVDTMLKNIVPMAKKVFTLTPHNERAAEGSLLKEYVQKINKDCENYQDYEEAYNRALSFCTAKDILVVCGSLYMIGDMRKVIKNA